MQGLRALGLPSMADRWEGAVWDPSVLEKRPVATSCYSGRNYNLFVKIADATTARAQPKLWIRGEGSEDGVVVLQTYANTPVTRLKWVSGPNPNRNWELTPNDIV